MTKNWNQVSINSWKNKQKKKKKKKKKKKLWNMNWQWKYELLIQAMWLSLTIIRLKNIMLTKKLYKLCDSI